MAFYDEFRKIIEKKIKERDAIDSIIKEISKLGEDEKIAFYPASRLTSLIIKEIESTNQELLKRIIACFDKSADATTESGIKVYPAEDLKKFNNEISLLIVPSNTFFSKEKNDLAELGFKGKILQTSFFEISLPKDMSDEEILGNIDKVYNLLEDNKSKTTYMIAWLSRLLNDETLTNIFESEEFIDDVTEPMSYKNYTIKNIDHTCKKELCSQLYKMKQVYPEKGDTVFDIGAYRGDTAIFFADEVGNTGKVYAFEPVPPNMEMLIENSKNNKLDNIIIPVAKGVSSETGSMKIVTAAKGAPWSFLSENRGNDIEITTIDDFVKNNDLKKLDFIKMDVEGFEENVINGAKESIKKFSPKLAIAAYHKTTDLFLIPLLIKSLGDYKIYMRSRVEGPFGFTFYFKHLSNK